jgi:hypothetical protein
MIFINKKGISTVIIKDIVSIPDLITNADKDKKSKLRKSIANITKAAFRLYTKKTLNII